MSCTNSNKHSLPFSWYIKKLPSKNKVYKKDIQLSLTAFVIFLTCFRKIIRNNFRVEWDEKKSKQKPTCVQVKYININDVTFSLQVIKVFLFLFFNFFFSSLIKQWEYLYWLMLSLFLFLFVIMLWLCVRWYSQNGSIKTILNHKKIYCSII